MSNLSFADAAAIADRERERACGIIELCVLAGRPTDAAEFIRSALDVGSVQLKLAREAEAVHPGAVHSAPKPSVAAGNGAAFNLAAIEAAIAEKRRLQ